MANYYEIFLSPQINKKNYGLLEEIDVNISKNDFYNMLSILKAANTDYKVFEKEYKEYVYSDVIVHNYNNDVTRVFKNTVLQIKNNEQLFVISYHRSKMTFLSVPSTTVIYEINYIRKLIFRVNNRIFINFQCTLSQDDIKTYSVYINYNHESNMDPISVQTALKKLISIFGYSNDGDPFIELGRELA
jgi:hypothetical protein